jgi:hypothetical protein
LIHETAATLLADMELSLINLKRFDGGNTMVLQNNPKYRHHDHSTGEDICALCKRCSLSRNYKNFKMRVIFHNFKGYDRRYVIKTKEEIILS